MDRNRDWLSVYLYVDHSLMNKTIVEFIKPLVENLKLEQNILDGFFFIRYFEDGSHLRLRIKSKTENIEEVIKPLLIEKILEYNCSHKQAINSYRYEPYVPEIERYGGVYSIGIAEEQFQASSEAIIEAIDTKFEKWDYSMALGTAISLHVTFLHAIGINFQTKTKLLNRICESWLINPILFFQKSINTGADSNEAKASIMKAFSQSYKRQEKELKEFISQLNESLRVKNDLPLWLVRWTNSIQKIHLEMLQLLKDEKLSINSKKSDREKISPIYESLFHMTNNRLGIRNMDESFLGFILLRLIEERALI